MCGLGYSDDVVSRLRRGCGVRQLFFKARNGVHHVQYNLSVDLHRGFIGNVFGCRPGNGIRRTGLSVNYQISLQNFRPGPIRVLVYDHIPVSNNSDITVNQGDFSDRPAALEKDTGKLTWEIDLPPKFKKVIEFGYSVEWPKGKEISGTF